MRSIIAILVNLSLCASVVIGQDTRQLERPKSTVQTEKRIALVIGNGAYQHATDLDNPTNDATDMARALREVGFEVIGGENDGVNLNQSQMETLIAQFGRRLAETKGVGLFYYAGHGVMSNGQNYLIPVDANIPDEDLIKYKAVSVGYVLDKMSAARNSFNLVILDACRNNPFARQWRTLRDIGDSKGLANSNPPRGTLVLYATQPGGTSIDGVGNSKNGLFTQALLKEIKTPNLELDPLVKLVAREVEAGSNQKQSPWKEGLYSGDFYFAGTTTTVNNIGTNNNNALNETPVVAKGRAAQEIEAWNLVRNSSEPQDFRSFLKEFPNGANAASAQIRLEQLVWESVKGSGNATKIKGYLDEFPSGANASSGRILYGQLTRPKIERTPTPFKRLTSKEKVVFYNLRALSVSAKQFCLENRVSAASFDDLVGPNAFIRKLDSVFGENYREIPLICGQPIQVTLPGGKLIEYKMDDK